MMPGMSKSPIEKACERVGGQTALARALKVSQQRVWGWVHKKKQIPAEFVLAAEAVTGIPRHVLRHDIYPPVLRPTGDNLGTTAVAEQVTA